MQTSISNIFACGDVAGPYQYTHMASYQAFFSSINAMLSGLWKIQANYKAVPWATYIRPEVAQVGLSETEARMQKLAMTRQGMSYLTWTELELKEKHKDL